jgi:hypothetical protein
VYSLKEFECRRAQSDAGAQGLEDLVEEVTFTIGVFTSQLGFAFQSLLIWPF